MRSPSMTIAVSCLLIAVPLVCFGSPARADNNDLMGQAQRFFNNKEGGSNAYERGRDDEMRRQQAEHEGNQYRRRDWDQENRYREPNPTTTVYVHQRNM